jgi:regulatory protein
MKSPYDLLWEKALKSISVRPMSRAELKKKLLTESSDEAIIDRILEEMERVQLINDKRYAELLLRHLIQKPIGRIKLEVELRKRGLHYNDCVPMLEELGYNEAAMAKKALEEKEGRVDEADPRKRKFKLMNYLRNRGFKDTTIYQVLRIQD